MNEFFIMKKDFFFFGERKYKYSTENVDNETVTPILRFEFNYQKISSLNHWMNTRIILTLPNPYIQ